MFCIEKNYKKKITFSFMAIALLSFAAMFQSCYAPSPLYGKWADNPGSSITFVADGSYTASIISNGAKTQYSGTYTVVENVIVFSKSTGTSINTEWDIRGSILYLTWTDDNGSSQRLELYRVSN